MKLLFIWLFTVNERSISLGFVFFATKRAREDTKRNKSASEKQYKTDQMKRNFSIFSTLYAEYIIGQAYHCTISYQSYYMGMDTDMCMSTNTHSHMHTSYLCDVCKFGQHQSSNRNMSNVE